MKVNYQKTIEFINECSCIVDEKELANAIIYKQQRPTCRLKKIYIHGNYPAISIYNLKIHIHRLLMEYWLDRKLQTKEYVHHKDGNKLNASKDNLELMSSSKHQSLTNKGRKQSDVHMKRRINSTSLTRYGRIIYEHPNLLKQ